MSEKQKIELQLDMKIFKKLKIISKAFGCTPEKFIEFSLKRDVKYIQDNIERKTFDDLRLEYNTEINEKVLEEIL